MNIVKFYQKANYYKQMAKKRPASVYDKNKPSYFSIVFEKYKDQAVFLLSNKGLTESDKYVLMKLLK